MHIAFFILFSMWCVYNITHLQIYLSSPFHGFVLKFKLLKIHFQCGKKIMQCRLICFKLLWEKKYLKQTNLHILQKHYRDVEIQPCIFRQWWKYQGPYEIRRKILRTSSQRKRTFFVCFFYAIIHWLVLYG